MSWLVRISQVTPESKFSEDDIRFRDECTGFHHGQTDCRLLAYLKDESPYAEYLGEELLGYCEYSSYNDEYHVNYIYVRDDVRHRGLGTMMWRWLQHEAAENGMMVNPGMSTPDGSGFLESVNDRSEG